MTPVVRRKGEGAGTADQDLADFIGGFYADPLGFVMAAFPWDSDPAIQLVPLAEPWAARYGCAYGPDAWACQFLEDLGEDIRARGFDGNAPVAPIMASVVSGHGVGKSTITAWLILFILSTRPFSKGIVTANTADQLKTKTWAELGKWHRRALTAHWFSYRAARGNMSLVSALHPEEWRVDAQTCREENSESFAGLHAASSTPFYIFDEASAVPDRIREVASGGLTDGEPMLFAFGNPTRNSGWFFESHHRQRHRYRRITVDSRRAAITNKDLFQDWIDDYGEDSDFVRVRVRGCFPRASSMQFISSTAVDQAMTRDPGTALDSEPVVMGVDVARFGDDQSVLVVRRGRNARDLHWSAHRGLSTMDLAARVADLITDLRVDQAFVDGGGVGGGVVDRLEQLGFGDRVSEVQFGARAQDARKYANKRAEMWGRMRDWLDRGAVPDTQDLRADLLGVEYGYVRENLIQLEKKESMKKRGLASPDSADALALTFADQVAPRFDDGAGDDRHHTSGLGYDPYAG